MRFCVWNSERHGTCYHELYKGQWDPENPEFWRDDSLYIHDDIFCEYPELQNAIKKVIPSYDSYSETVVTKQNWVEIGVQITNANQDTHDFFNEIDEWAKPVLSTYGMFTILGI